MATKLSKVICVTVDFIITFFMWAVVYYLMLRYVLSYVNASMYRFALQSNWSDVQFVAMYEIPFIALNVVTLSLVTKGLMVLTKRLFIKSFVICDKFTKKSDGISKNVTSMKKRH